MTLQTNRDTFYIKQGNTSPAVEVQLTNEDGDPIDLTRANNVVFKMYESRWGGKQIEKPAAVINPEEGVVAYSWNDGETDQSGRYRSEFVINFPGTSHTVPNFGYKDILIWGTDNDDVPVGDEVMKSFPATEQKDTEWQQQPRK